MLIIVLQLWVHHTSVFENPNIQNLFLFTVSVYIRMDVWKSLQMIREIELLPPMWLSHLMVKG
jgi:hypothetical protein